jgi:cell division protein FtsW (lipid II flippase)
LTAIGLLAIGTTRPELVPKQSALLVVGLIAAGMVTWPSHRFLQWVSWPLLALVMLLLVFL